MNFSNCVFSCATNLHFSVYAEVVSFLIYVVSCVNSEARLVAMQECCPHPDLYSVRCFSYVICHAIKAILHDKVFYCTRCTFVIDLSAIFCYSSWTTLFADLLYRYCSESSPLHYRLSATANKKMFFFVCKQLII